MSTFYKTKKTMKIPNKNIILNWLFYTIITIVFGIIAGFITWQYTKEKTEITLKLESWIIVGSFIEQELSGLSLMLDGDSLKNIMKISWQVVNSGDKGITTFETGPYFEFPRNLDVISAKISNKSPLLKISENLNIIDSLAYVDSLGIFNSGDFFKVDFYLKDIEEQHTTNEYFNNWHLNGKSLDLTIITDIEFTDVITDIYRDLSIVSYSLFTLGVILITFTIMFITFAIRDIRMRKELATLVNKVKQMKKQVNPKRSVK